MFNRSASPSSRSEVSGSEPDDSLFAWPFNRGFWIGVDAGLAADGISVFFLLSSSPLSLDDSDDCPWLDFAGAGVAFFAGDDRAGFGVVLAGAGSSSSLDDSESLFFFAAAGAFTAKVFCAGFGTDFGVETVFSSESESSLELSGFFAAVAPVDGSLGNAAALA